MSCNINFLTATISISTKNLQPADFKFKPKGTKIQSNSHSERIYAFKNIESLLHSGNKNPDIQRLIESEICTSFEDSRQIWLEYSQRVSGRSSG